MESECLTPDDITFICIISACSHSGLVYEGKHWFDAMTQTYDIKLRMEHYICIVDLLGRGGFLEEAYDLFQKLLVEPDVRVWGTLLGAFHVHENIDLGEEVSRMIQKLGPEGTGNFVLLSNLYSAARRYDENRKVELCRDKQKSPGCSWLEIKGTIHAFIGGRPQRCRTDKKQRSSVYQKSVDIKKLGYLIEVLHCREEKEHALLYHSKKLAIVYGILHV